MRRLKMHKADGNKRYRWMIQAAIPCGVLAGSWVAALLVYGSVSAAVDRLAGYAARPVHQIIDIGQVRELQPVRVAIPLQNLLGEPLTVIGVETDCGCAVAEGLPLEIPAFSRDEFQLMVTPPARLENEVLDRWVLLFLNVNSRPVRIRVSGSVARLPG